MAPLASASLRPRRRAARAIGILGGLLLLVGIVAAAAPWAFSTKALRLEIEAQVRQMTGLATVSQGQAVFVVLPQPHISIDDISLTDPSGALRIDARFLKGYLRVSALLRGQLEIAWASLGQPDMVIDLDGRPMPSDSAIGRAANAKSASPQATSADEARLAAVTLVDGRARLKSKLGASDVLIDGINVTLDWRKLGDAARVTGQARFHGETANISAWVRHPTDLLRGGRSALTLNIDGTALSLATEGVLASAPTAQYSGHVVAAAPSIRKLVEWGGYFIRLPASFDDFALEGDASVEASGAAFSGLRLRLDGNDFEGALAVQTGEKTPVLSGTLATNLLSLRPFLANLPATVGRDGQWNRDPFDPNDLGLVDLDLRVSATRVVLPTVEMEDAAFALMSRNDRLEFTLAEAKAYQGKVKGRASVAAESSRVSVRANGAISDVDMAGLPPGAIGAGRFIGALTGSANVESSGSSVSELMRNLEGEAQITIAPGELIGIDLPQALRRIDKRPLALAIDIRHGGTAFNRASFGLRIAKGVADIQEGALRGPGVNLGFGGSIDFAERALNLRALATPSAAEPKPGQESPQFRFDVVGSWDDLAFLPDVRSLIRRSDAAAPLLSPKSNGGKSPQGGERQD